MRWGCQLCLLYIQDLNPVPTLGVMQQRPWAQSVTSLITLKFKAASTSTAAKWPAVGWEPFKALIAQRRKSDDELMTGSS